MAIFVRALSCAAALAFLAPLGGTAWAQQDAHSLTRIAPSRVTVRKLHGHGVVVQLRFRVVNRGGTQRPRTVRLTLRHHGRAWSLGTMRIPGLAVGEHLRRSVTRRVRRRMAPGRYRLRVCDQSGPRRRCAYSRRRVVVRRARYALDPGGLDVGRAIVGAPSAVRTVRITNAGDVSSARPALWISGADAWQFAVVENRCTHRLAPGRSCTAGVRLTPFSPGVKQARLEVTGIHAGRGSVPLTGQAQAPPPLAPPPGPSLPAPASPSAPSLPPAPAALAIDPSSEDFGAVATGLSSSATSFTVTNTGGVATSPLAASLAGADAGAFALPAGSDGCSGTSLAPGASCTLDVVFAPTSTGAQAATLTVDAATGGSAASALTGTGSAPAALAVGPASNDFGSVATGLSSSATSFTVTNLSDVATGAVAVSLSGADAGAFELPAASDGCSGTILAPGASCTFDVVFAPTSTGAQAATLWVGAAGSTTVVANVEGTGVAPAHLTITSAGDFGNVLAGTTSATRTFTITNTGDVSTGAVSLAETGANAAQFPTSGSTCGGALAAGSSCTVQVAFSPVGTGTRAATLTAAASPGGSAAVSLAGSGVATAANLTVSPASASMSMTLTAGHSYSGYVVVANTGDADSGPLSAQLELVSGSGVTLKGVSPMSNGTVPACGAILAGGASCSYAWGFHAEASGTFPLVLAVHVSAAPGGTPTATFNFN